MLVRATAIAAIVGLALHSNSQQSHLDLNSIISCQLNEIATKVEDSHCQAKAAHNMHVQALDRAAGAWNAYVAATTRVHTSLIGFHDAALGRLFINITTIYY
jgi:hypothetical protein